MAQTWVQRQSSIRNTVHLQLVDIWFQLMGCPNIIYPPKGPNKNCLKSLSIWSIDALEDSLTWESQYHHNTQYRLFMLPFSDCPLYHEITIYSLLFQNLTRQREDFCGGQWAVYINIIIYIFQCYSLNPSHLIALICPRVCSLSVHL